MCEQGATIFSVSAKNAACCRQRSAAIRIFCKVNEPSGCTSKYRRTSSGAAFQIAWMAATRSGGVRMRAIQEENSIGSGHCCSTLTDVMPALRNNVSHYCAE